jgi:hypothetical protein
VASAFGTFETWRPALTTSVSKGRPEVVGRDQNDAIDPERTSTGLSSTPI